jgi:hypothetical protein
MARLIEAMHMIYMIPLLQRRSAEWEFFFRRNKEVVCWWQAEWADPVFDAENLANMPQVLAPAAPCP